MTGRPSSFTQEMADAICERITGGESLRSICDDAEFPAASTVFKWLRDFPVFSEQYARAREAQADALFDEILDIADNARNDWMARLGDDEKDAGYQLNGEHVQRSKIRIDARKWMAGKLRPKVYGEKQSVEHSGPDGGPIETKEHAPRDLAKVLLEKLMEAKEG